MADHTDAHRGIKRFSCELCGHRFRTRAVLKRHQRGARCHKFQDLKSQPMALQNNVSVRMWSGSRGTLALNKYPSNPRAMGYPVIMSPWPPCSRVAFFSSSALVLPFSRCFELLSDVFLIVLLVRS